MIPPVVSQAQTHQNTVSGKQASSDTSNTAFVGALKDTMAALFAPVAGGDKKDHTGFKKNKEEKTTPRKILTVYDFIGRVEATERQAKK